MKLRAGRTGRPSTGVGRRPALVYGGAMDDEPEPPEETPWEVNEYRFEPPGWFELLVAGNPGVYPPLILVVGYLIWLWASG